MSNKIQRDVWKSTQEATRVATWTAIQAVAWVATQAATWDATRVVNGVAIDDAINRELEHVK
jgi:hypothetical protein